MQTKLNKKAKRDLTLLSNLSMIAVRPRKLEIF